MYATYTSLILFTLTNLQQQMSHLELVALMNRILKHNRVVDIDGELNTTVHMYRQHLLNHWHEQVWLLLPVALWIRNRNLRRHYG